MASKSDIITALQALLQTNSTGDISPEELSTEIEKIINNTLNIDDDVVSQVDAEAGTSTDLKLWTAERVKQAIDAQVLDPTIIQTGNNNFETTGSGIEADVGGRQMMLGQDFTSFTQMIFGDIAANTYLFTRYHPTVEASNQVSLHLSNITAFIAQTSGGNISVVIGDAGGSGITFISVEQQGDTINLSALDVVLSRIAGLPGSTDPAKALTLDPTGKIIYGDIAIGAGAVSLLVQNGVTNANLQTEIELIISQLGGAPATRSFLQMYERAGFAGLSIEAIAGTTNLQFDDKTTTSQRVDLSTAGFSEETGFTINTNDITVDTDARLSINVSVSMLNQASGYSYLQLVKNDTDLLDVALFNTSSTNRMYHYTCFYEGDFVATDTIDIRVDSDSASNLILSKYSILISEIS